MTLIQSPSLKSIIFIGLIIFYSIFFINLITDDRSSLTLTYLIILLIILYFFKKKNLFINPIIFSIAISSSIFITLNEYIFHAHQSSFDLGFNRQADKYINQFLYFIPFIFLATLFNFSRFSTTHFKKIVLLSIVFSLLFNTYLNIFFDFNRGLLNQKFTGIILYDYCIIALSLIALCFSFELNKKASYIFIGLCLLNISMIVMHGTRGAWLGLPIALIFICLFYYKMDKNRTIYMLLLSLILSIVMITFPHSPIVERFEQFENDKSLMQDNNYNSSVGTRFALWAFAVQQFEKSPYIGHGIINFRNQICEAHEQNQLPACHSHAHNTILEEMAAHGILGIINLLTILILTLYYFIFNLIKSINTQTKNLAFTGLTCSIYIIICSMSDFIFLRSFPTMFTFLIILTLMSLIHSEKIMHKINSSKNE